MNQRNKHLSVILKNRNIWVSEKKEKKKRKKPYFLGKVSFYLWDIHIFCLFEIKSKYIYFRRIGIGIDWSNWIDTNGFNISEMKNLEIEHFN